MISGAILSVDRYEYVVAQCVEILAWLGWLRSKELFSMKIEGSEFIPSSKHDKYNLPENTYTIVLRPLPSTKSSNNKQAGVVIAWRTFNGLSLGYWIQQLLGTQTILN